jgi:hypothetical protein
MMVVYEKLLDSDPWWAFHQGSLHFEKQSAVHATLVKFARRLEELGIPYAVLGAMALFFHGYRRFTESVDVLVSPEGLQEIHRRLEGAGYVRPRPDRRTFRDSEHGVRIEFQVSGERPGDGKPKPVTFPRPEESGVLIGEIRVLELARLLEVKLVSGMSCPKRLKDLADVQEAIAHLRLPASFALRLHPSVQDQYRQLWDEVQNFPAEP